MKLTRSAKLAFNMLIHSKLRSWLTIIGIVIGVAAVVIIISAGASAQATLEAQFTQFGTDYVTVNPDGAMGPMSGGPVGGKLTDKDVQSLEGIIDVKMMSPQIYKQADITYAGETKFIQVVAMVPSVWSELAGDEGIAIGRGLTDTDMKEVVLGKNVAEDAFDRDITINQAIQINGQNFRVVGIVENSGLMAMMDNFIFMHIEPAKNVLYAPGEVVTYMEIDILVQPGSDVNAVADEVERRLLLSRHETGKDATFMVMTPDDILDQLGEIMTMVTAVLGAIAVISLIVGAVGIMNTMFTSALEKTKEIGIMKSIGATNKDIVTIFLLNAGMVGFVGGALGCALGIGVLYAMVYGVATLGIDIVLVISPMFIAQALLLAAGIGMLAGAIPAWRASKLKPVDALRYE